MSVEVSECHFCGEAKEIRAYVMGELGLCKECATQIIRLSREETP